MFFFWTLVPAILFAISNLMQKVGLDGAHKNAKDLAQGEAINNTQHVKSVLKNLTWWLGIGLAFFGTLGYYVALDKYNMSLVQPLMALNPVLTAIGGWWLLKEYLDKRTLVAIIFVVLGLMVAGALHNEELGIESTQGLQVFTLSIIAFCFGLLFLLKHTESRRSLIAGMAFGLSSVLIKSLTHHVEVLGGLSTQTLLDWGVILRAVFYVGTYLWGFFLMQMALAQGRSLFVVPLVSAAGMLIPSLAGVLVFQEPLSLTKALAIALVFCGSCLFIRKAP